MKQPDSAEFRRAVSRFTTGVTIITTRDRGEGVVGMTANSFTSVSLAPPTVLVSVMEGRTLQAIGQCGRFGINVLPASAKALTTHFAGRLVPGLVPQFVACDGMPRLAEAIAYFDCEVEKSIPVADHTLLVGAVRACGHADADPLVFFSSEYRNLRDDHGRGSL